MSEALLSRYSLSPGSEQTGALWLHFDASNAATREQLEAFRPELPTQVISALLAEDTRPRFTRFDTGFLLNLRGVNLNQNAEPEDMVSIRIWCDGTHVISARLRKLLAVDDMRKAFDEGDGPVSAIDLVISLVHRLSQRMEPTIEALHSNLESMETAGFSSNLDSKPEDGLSRRTTLLARRASMMQRYMIPQKAALEKLETDPHKFMNASQLTSLHEGLNRLILFTESLAEIRERSSLLRGEIDYQVANIMNRHTHLLTVVAAVFLPMGFLTGLMGINVGGMPWVEDAMGFWYVTGGIGMISLLLLVLFWLKRWF